VRRRALFFLALLLGLGIYLYLRFDEYARTGVTPIPVAGEEESFFASARLERDRARSREAETLRRAAEAAGEDEEFRRAARQKLLLLGERTRKEREAEILLQARGYRKALVLFHERGAVVIVEGLRLGPRDAERIAEAVAEVGGIPRERVRVTPYRAAAGL